VQNLERQLEEEQQQRAALEAQAQDSSRRYNRARERKRQACEELKLAQAGQQQLQEQLRAQQQELDARCAELGEFQARVAEAKQLAQRGYCAARPDKPVVVPPPPLSDGDS
jgi:chromosome segregation ATPase